MYHTHDILGRASRIAFSTISIVGFLNPFTSWKGNAESRKKMIEIIPANQLDLFGISEEDHKIREKNEIKNGVQLIENQTNIIDQIKELEDK